MKYRLTASLLSLLVAVFFMGGLALADSLTLTKIGSLSTAGKTYPEWWYTGTNPTFYGTADNADTVTLKIGDKSYDTTANIEGKWDIPVAAAAGDYSVFLTSGDAHYNFTLHLGKDFTGTTNQTSSSTSSVPTTGVEQTTALTLGVGVSLLALYLYFFDASKKHKVFEKKIVSDK